MQNAVSRRTPLQPRRNRHASRGPASQRAEERDAVRASRRIPGEGCSVLHFAARRCQAAEQTGAPALALHGCSLATLGSPLLYPLRVGAVPEPSLESPRAAVTANAAPLSRLSLRPGSSARDEDDAPGKPSAVNAEWRQHEFSDGCAFLACGSLHPGLLGHRHRLESAQPATGPGHDEKRRWPIVSVHGRDRKGPQGTARDSRDSRKPARSALSCSIATASA